MKVLAKILKYFGLAVAGCVILTLIAAASLFTWVYLHPGETWQIVSHRYLPADLKVTWQDAHFSARHSSWKNWTVDVDIEDLLVVKTTPSIIAPVDHLRLVAEIKIFSPSWSVHLHELGLDAKKLISYRGESAAAPETTQVDYEKLINRTIRYVRVVQSKLAYDQISIDVANISLVPAPDAKNPAKPIHLRVNLTAHHDEPLHASFAVTGFAEQLKNLEADGTLDLDRLEQPRPFGHFSVKALGEGLRVQSAITLTYQPGTARAEIDSTVDFEKGRAHAVLHPLVHVVLNDKELSAKIAAELSSVSVPIVKLRDVTGEFHMPLSTTHEWMSAPSTFQVRLPIELYFLDKNLRPPIEDSCKCRIPEEVLADVKGRAWIGALAAGDTTDQHSERNLLDIDVAVTSLKNRLFDIDLGGNLKVKNDHGQWKLEPIMNSQLVIHSFQGLRRILDAKNVLIPAPLDVLDGIMVLNAKAPIKIDYTGNIASALTTACDLSVDLKSPKQNVSFKTTADLKADHGFKRFYVDLKAVIDRLELQLPPFKPIAGVPKFVRDSRILLKPAQLIKAHQATIVLNATVETSAPGAVKLYSGLASPFVPIDFKISQSVAAGADGVIRVEPFKIVYLHRTLAVDSLNLNLKETSTHDYPLTGDFHVDQTNYKVKIHIAGTTSNPQIQLSSVPDLKNDDIISVLLYDRTTDELGAGDAETAGNVQAAMADHAIGLLGLWLFAATPIKSFTYNPLTKVYSATVALGNGVTAGVGTDWEQSTMVEVRKRLSQRWIVMASWSPSQEDPDRKVGKLTLQWERRF